mgnify:CR=1 FL=1
MRQGAARALGMLAANLEDEAVLERVVEALASTLQDSEAQVRLAAAKGLGNPDWTSQSLREEQIG